MKIFNLPDLGEGLPEAEIREWFIHVGDTVKTDQPLAAVETAKALVDIPAPFDGTVEQLFGGPGDTIQTGEPLIGFSGESDQAKKKGTVVGEIPESNTVVDSQIITSKKQTTSTITPAVRALARKLKVDINSIASQGERITIEDVKRHSKASEKLSPHFKKIPATKQAMSLAMQQSHREVAPITVTADANITPWFKKEDLTLRTIRALTYAIQQEPILNSHFHRHNNSYRSFKEINLGLAVDTAHGLYVPVIKDIESLPDSALRHAINEYKEQAENKSISQADSKNATIVLSNFGVHEAKYGTPIITPPMVCIIGVGRVYQGAIVKQGELSVGALLPISITADHRLISGGEVTRFLAAFKQHCEKQRLEK